MTWGPRNVKMNMSELNMSKNENDEEELTSQGGRAARQRKKESQAQRHAGTMGARDGSDHDRTC